MRSLMLAAALALTSLVVQPAADACGYYGSRAPALFLVTSHHDGAHTFVLLNQDVDEKAHSWRVLDEMSFDRTSVAAAPRLSAPMQFTLVGADGTKVISTREQVLVKEMPGAALSPTVAVRVPRGQFTVALRGARENLAWEEVTVGDNRAEVDAWMRDIGATGTSAWISRAGGTEMLTIHNPQTNKYETQIKQLGWWFGRDTGAPLGVITIEGTRYAVLIDGNVVSTLEIGPTAQPRR